MAASEALLADIFDRLVAADQSDEVVDLVLAALEGPDALDALLGGQRPPRPATTPDEAAAVPAVEGVHLAGISVRAFRGIGPEAELPLEAGNGLTVVVGANGSGKSSFAEALEVALTGNAHRFQRSQVWKKGWRNVHDGGPARVQVAMHVPGRPGITRLVCQWPGDDVERSNVSVHPPAGAAFPLAELGWGPALTAMPPLCANGEIESLIEASPSKLYDRLSAVLGLDDVEAAAALLNERQAVLKAQLDQRDKAKKAAAAAVAGVDDERARSVAQLLGRRPPPLDVIEALVTGTAGTDPQVATLEALAALGPIDLEVVTALAGQLRASQRDVDTLDTPETREARLTAELLDGALRVHEHRADATCPVCGTPGVLDGQWRARASELCDALRRRAADLDGAVRHRRQVLAMAGHFSQPRPLDDPRVEGVDVDGLAGAWAAWQELCGETGGDAAAVADAFEQQALVVEERRARVADAAQRELDARQSAWREAAHPVADYLALARAAAPVEPAAKTMRTAAGWLSATLQAMRNERVDAVRGRARALWAKLRQQSSVELRDFTFEGRGKQRHVTFDVLIDGTASQALGVMSQGELNALALAVFLPRATQAESPFRFVVIDDPVQAMDPAKVDGLAQVLHELSADRQVIVFTHDLRLVEAVEQLGVPATVLTVERGPGSAVTVRRTSDAVTRLLDEAAALPRDEAVPVQVAGRVAPNLCRQALEMALARRFRRARYQAGDDPAAVEAALGATRRLYELAALALLGDVRSTDRVLEHLNRRWNRRAGDAFLRLNEAGHGGLTDHRHVSALVDDARYLIDKVAA